MKKRSRILDEMQETVEGLLQANIITQLQADEIVALCQTQITPLNSSEYLTHSGIFSREPISV